MNLFDDQIRALLAPIYKEACLDGDISMCALAELLEYLAERFKNENPHTLWQRLDIDKEQYDKPDFRNYLVRLKKAYYIVLADTTETEIHTRCKNDPEEAFNYWEKTYIKALAQWNSILYSRLCSASFNFSEEKLEHIEQYRKINALIFDGRWDGVYPFYCNQAQNAGLPNKRRSEFAVYAGQIQLYHLLPDHDAALNHFEMAEQLDKGSNSVRALGEYHLALSDYEKAREYFMSALSTDPADISNYLYIGDSYRDENQLDVAKQWYEDALRMNFMEPAAYRRLVLLCGRYRDEPARKKEIHRLVIQTENIEIDHPDENLLYDLYRDAGNAFYYAGDYGESEIYYRRATDRYPQLVQAYIDLGYILTYDERCEEALDIFDKADSLGEPLFYVYWGMAYTHEKMERYRNVIGNYKKCLELLPSRAETIKYNIGYFYEKLEDLDKAKAYYRELALEYPDTHKYIKEYKKLLNESVEDNEPEKLLTERVQNNPNSPTAHNELGNHYYEQKKFEKAIPEYEKAIELNAGEPVYWENLGLVFQNTTQHEKAENAYQKANELDSNSGQYVNRLGVFYNTIGKHAKAASYYSEALEREPGNVLYLNNLGIGYSWLGQLEKAVETFEKVLLSTPENLSTHTELASALMKLKRYDEARHHLKKAIALEPENLNHLGNIGFVYQQLGDYNRALEAYTKALEKDPKSDYYHNQAGVMHYWLKEFEEAKKHYRLAIQNNPDVELYYSNLGLVLDDLNETDAAREAYEKSNELAARNTENIN